jgi:hypothetical protein
MSCFLNFFCLRAAAQAQAQVRPLNFDLGMVQMKNPTLSVGYLHVPYLWRLQTNG